MATASHTTKEKRHQNQRFNDVSEEPDKVLSPLPLLVPASSILSLQRAVEPIHHLVSDLPNKVSYSLDRCKNPQDGLTQEESATIFLYTLQWPPGQVSFFTMFNRALRDENRIKMIPFQHYYQLFMAAFSKLPSTRDQVWRGEAGDWGARYEKGKKECRTELRTPIHLCRLRAHLVGCKFVHRYGSCYGRISRPEKEMYSFQYKL